MGWAGVVLAVAAACFAAVLVRGGRNVSARSFQGNLNQGNAGRDITQSYTAAAPPAEPKRRPFMDRVNLVLAAIAAAAAVVSAVVAYVSDILGAP